MLGPRHLLALAAGALLAAAPAIAADEPKPEPTSCAGLSITDPKGDGTAPNMDVTGAFFRYDKGTLTANIRLANLDKTLPQARMGISWTMTSDDSGDDYFYARAHLDVQGNVTYTYGSYIDTWGPPKDTTGKFIEGPDGIIQIVIPEDANGLASKKVKTPTIGVRNEQVALPTGDLGNDGDVAPNTGTGKDFAIAECTEAPVTTPTDTTPVTTPATNGNTEPPAATQQQQAPTAQGQQPAAQSGPVALPVKLGANKLVAKKLKKAKKLTLKLASTGKVSGLTVQLARAGKVRGSGSLAALDGAGKVTLKLTGKGLKKGLYQLRLAGTDASGRAGTAVLSLKVR